MPREQQKRYTAFAGHTRIAAGTLPEVVSQVKARIDRGKLTSVLIFADETGKTVDLDLRGAPAAVLAELAAAYPEAASEQGRTPKPGPGRPKLGVVAREVTLLPRHWDWLNSQPGGASVTLRKLVEHAMRNSRETDTVRRAQEAVFRFMNTIAGDFPNYEEALRALFAGDSERFTAMISGWPEDIRDHAIRMAAPAMTRSEK